MNYPFFHLGAGIGVLVYDIASIEQSSAGEKESPTLDLK